MNLIFISYIRDGYIITCTQKISIQDVIIFSITMLFTAFSLVVQKTKQITHIYECTHQKCLSSTDMLNSHKCMFKILCLQHNSSDETFAHYSNVTRHVPTGFLFWNPAGTGH